MLKIIFVTLAALVIAWVAFTGIMVSGPDLPTTFHVTKGN